MEHDVDALKNLLSSYDQHFNDEKAKAQRQLDEKISLNKSSSTKPLNDKDISNITNNFWKQKQPVLNAFQEKLSKAMLQGIADSREGLVELIQENSKSNEVSNDSLSPEFNKMDAYEERMNKFRENKKSMTKGREL